MYFTLFVATILASPCYISASGREYPTSVIFKWNYINYTFESSDDYEEFTNQNRYIPENNYLAGIKIYKNQTYVSLTRYRNGTPVTLATIPQDAPAENPLLSPFPNWNLNVDGDNCSTIQNVRSMEIDNDGIMWVIDGVRYHNVDNNDCPQKLLLLDLNQNGQIVHTFTFPENVSSKNNGYLNDIVLDDNYAFITETSDDSPGLIVYSRHEDKAWKLFDNESMTYDRNAENFTINGDFFTRKQARNIYGIALNAVYLPDNDRYVYYTPSTGYQMYRVPLNVLKNKEYYENSDRWKDYIQTAVRKVSGQSNGMAFSSRNDLLYTSVDEHALAVLKPGENRIIYSNNDSFAWPETIAFDNMAGSFYITSNRYAYKFPDPDQDIPTDDFAYFITKRTSGANSYMYPTPSEDL